LKQISFTPGFNGLHVASGGDAQERLLQAAVHVHGGLPSVQPSSAHPSQLLSSLSPHVSLSWPRCLHSLLFVEDVNIPGWQKFGQP
jgi:hypothetical protein